MISRGVDDAVAQFAKGSRKRQGDEAGIGNRAPKAPKEPRGMKAFASRLGTISGQRVNTGGDGKGAGIAEANRLMRTMRALRQVSARPDLPTTIAASFAKMQAPTVGTRSMQA